MTTTSHSKPPPLREVLYAFAMEAGDVNADLVDKYIRQYPEYAEPITELAIDRAIDAMCLEPAVASAGTAADSMKVTPAVSRAMSRFQNRLHAVTKTIPLKTSRTCEDASPAENPFSSLDKDSFRSVAKRLNANNVFVAKLRDRQIDPVTLTQGFLRFVAELLKVTVERLSAHFDAPAVVNARPQFFKADRKPEAGARQTFTEAVRSSGLSEEQQRFLLNL